MIKKISLFFILSYTFLMLSSCESECLHYMGPYKYGYMDFSGNIIIEPNLEYSRKDMYQEDIYMFNINFSDGTSRFRINGEIGFINNKGNIIIPAEYDYAEEFNNGFAWVKSNNKWGKIDKKGNYIVEPKFDEIKFPQESLIGVKIDDKWGYADEMGNIVIKPEYDDVLKFEGDYAFVNKGKYAEYTETHVLIRAESGYWGCIDKSGKVMIEPKYNYDNIDKKNFSDDLMCISWYSQENNWYEYVYINNKMEIVIEPNCRTAYNFSDGLALIQNKDSFDYYYIDTMGKKAFDKTFFKAGSFNEGFAYVKPAKDDNKWGFIDKSGDIIIEPQFEYIAAFYEGLARVYKDEKYGYIDYTGKVIIPFQYDSACDFKNGIAYADGKLIDKQGNVVVEAPSGYHIFYHTYYEYRDGLVPIIFDN